MALVDNAWYVNFGDGATTGYYGVTKWANKTAAAGEIIRQFTAPAVGSERCFVCIIGGATGAVEPTWVNTRGAKNVSSSATYQECTGIAALNGDATNTPNWTTVKNTAITLGQVIKRNNGASYQICTTAGTAGNGSEPAFSDTAGTTTADNTVTWTSIGVVGNFTGWQAPHARLANAFAANWGQAGNSFYVGDNHAETQASALTLTSPGTNTAPVKVICANRSGSVPPVSADIRTTATVSCTGANAISFGGTDNPAIYDGLKFNSGSGSAGNSSIAWTGGRTSAKYRNCALKLGNTASGNNLVVGQNANVQGGAVDLENTTIEFTNNAQSCIVISRLTYRNTPSAMLGASLPTTLFKSFAATGGTIHIDGVDLSAITGTIVALASGAVAADAVLTNCKINASATIASTPASRGAGVVDYVDLDSGGTNYRHGRVAYDGKQTEETTIVRTSGASDGTTTMSEKIVTTANASLYFPFECQPIAIWNDTTGTPITVTLYGIWGGGAVPNNDDIFMEVEYPGSASTPQASFASNAPADILAARSALTTDSSTWGGSTTAFKMSVTFTPQQKGDVLIRVKAAAASATFYIDPKPEISGVTFAKSHALPGLYVNELQASGGGGHIATRQQLGM